MPYGALHPRVHNFVALALLTAACADDVAAPSLSPSTSPLLSSSARGSGDDVRGGAFRFTPLLASAPCAPSSEKPFLLPPGFEQIAFAREGDGGTVDLWDMHTQNETGRQAGRYLYRTHETAVSPPSQVSVTDLWSISKSGDVLTSDTRVLAQRDHWERFDGIAWTPWGTLLAAEEAVTAARRDPDVPQAEAGLVYEIDPKSGAVKARPAIGSRSHEGLRFDPAGNLYGISEGRPPSAGYIYKFTPDRRGDLSKGQLYALKIVAPTSDRTGEAVWVSLDRAAVQVNSDREATLKGATGYGRPEDVESATSTGRYDPWILFVAVTDPNESRVLAIDLGHGGRDGGRAFVYDYVRAGANAPVDFSAPDNLALDKWGNLYITEDPGANPVGADIWVAEPGRGKHRPAKQTARFASLSDCAAEPTGIYFDLSRSILYAHVQHRGGPDPRDFSTMIFASKQRDGGDDE